MECRGGWSPRKGPYLDFLLQSASSTDFAPGWPTAAATAGTSTPRNSIKRKMAPATGLGAKEKD